jgi:hypothetical protein
MNLSKTIRPWVELLEARNAPNDLTAAWFDWSPPLWCEFFITARALPSQSPSPGILMKAEWEEPPSRVVADRAVGRDDSEDQSTQAAYEPARNPLFDRHSAGRSNTYIERSNGLNVPTMEKGKTEIEFGDVNADGYVDLVSIGDHGSPNINSTQKGIMVWFGNRLGNWSLFQTGNFGYGGIALGDVNQDRAMDVAYSMHHNWSATDFGDQLMEVALGDGTGQVWTPWDDGLATNGEDYGMFETDLADVNNDGHLDVGAVSFGCCSGVHVYLNQANGSWVQSFGVNGGNTRNNFFFGDINGDGNMDLASGHAGNTVYLGDGSGNFSSADGNLPPAGSFGRGSVSLGDVNADGRLDLGYVTGGGGIAVWSLGAGGVWQNLSGNLPGSGQTEVAQIADMNLDGYGDVVAFAKGLVTVYTGDGAGNWQAASSFSSPGIYGYAAFRVGTDVDHNGYPDIGIVAAEGSSASNARNRPRVFVENSIPDQASVYPVSPRGGETFKLGATRFIDWHAALPPAVRRSTMSIDVSVTGPNGPWQSIATGQPNNGRYQWLVPSGLQATNKAYLRFTVQSPHGVTTAVTPRPFSLIP